MSSKLRVAIQGLYRAFARPVPASVYGCPCCTTEKQLRALVTTPLRELTDEQLNRYGFSALLTIGSADDLPYFWPRLVELAVEGDGGADREVVFEKPVLGNWRTNWSRAEQEATEAFVAALLEDMAEREYDSEDVDSWICALAHLMEDLPPLLEPLLRPSPGAGRNLHALYSRNARKVARGKMGSPFWEDIPEAEAAVARWLQSAEVQAAHARYYETESAFDPDCAS